jgi:uncharacterized surface protein with fasciclin (FAS1) repeats
MKNMIQSSKKLLLLLILVLCPFIWTGCLFNNDPIEEFYYTNTGKTVAGFLNDNPDEYGQFVSILKRAGMYDQLSTYGEYTCFAITNGGIDTLLLQKNIASIDALTDADCDTIAKTHVIQGLYYTTDLEVGAIPGTNFLDRYLMYSTASDTVNGKVSVAYLINKTAKIIARDDSVQNGVVHTINRVVKSSNRYLPQLMLEDSTISIFTNLLYLTGLDKKMEVYQDKRYTIGSDSVILGNAKVTWVDGPRDASYPEKRKFGFTAFVEPNVVYRGKGVRSTQELIDQLISKTGAFAVYDPSGHYTYDNNYTDSSNVVYRYVAYHLINRLGNYNQWNASATIRDNCAVYNFLDPQDFYETMDHTILKFQTSRDGQLYLNRRRINEGAGAIRNASDPFQAAVRGVRVMTPTESGNKDQSALNGVYHYIDAPLIFDYNAADALNTRMRIDASTLSPDFLNNPGRNRSKPDGSRYLVTRYKMGFVENFTFTPQTQIGVRNDPEWSPSYQRDGLDFLGQYDFTVKIPPVPDGQYEVRLGINAGNDRGIVQVYIDDEPCGIPIDMRVYKSDPKIGAVDDTEEAEENHRNDKDLKNRGYMKGPDSWKTSNLNDASQVSLRLYWNSMRIILATKNFRYGETHYLRFKSVIDNPRGIFPFDYMELCPKSVYGNQEGEDQH